MNNRGPHFAGQNGILPDRGNHHRQHQKHYIDAPAAFVFDATKPPGKRGPLATSQQSSEPLSPPTSSSDSDEDGELMYDIAGEHQHDGSPAAITIPLRNLKNKIPSSTPSSSTGSGIKRRLSANFDQHVGKKPTPSSYEQPRGESSASHIRTAPSPTKRHASKLTARRQASARATDGSPAVPTQAQRPDRAFIAHQDALYRQQSWQSTNQSLVPGLMSDNVPLAGRMIGKSFQAAPSVASDMFLQPETPRITQEQLAAEVKGIYAGLVMVEAKSIEVDAQQAADPTSPLASEQWQALIALRRTLLYEHYDFLMATQHPSSNAALRGLAAKYCMPARMWKHGIHGFLEVLRHRRPASQEYMLTFIYLAYDMITLLLETVPAFTDTWVECLGDLARYRMAIEEDKEVHAGWGGVAARWYTLAADRHPQIGRLYHHLGILERPSLRKFYFYSRSLTSVVPFVNARESLGTLCAPILQDDAAIRHGAHSAEAMTICYHARVFSGQGQDVIERDGNNALALLKVQSPGKIASYATPLAVTNIAGLFEFGVPNNIFKQLFASALARAAHNARPSILNLPAMSDAAKAINDSEAFAMTTYPTDYVIGFFANCFNSLIRQRLDHATIRDLLQYVHVNLVWLSSLLDLRLGLTLPDHRDIVNKVLSLIDWEALAHFLNELAAIDPITTRVIEHACYNTFLLAENWRDRKPLAEDFLIRGIAWSEGYLPMLLFEDLEEDDGSRVLETPTRLHLRAERVEWLACCIARPSKQSRLTFDRSTKKFATRTWAEVEATSAETTTYAWIKSEHDESPVSAHSSMEEEYDTLSVQSEDVTQFTPSVDSVPSRTEESFVDGKPTRN